MRQFLITKFVCSKCEGHSPFYKTFRIVAEAIDWVNGDRL